MTDSTFDIFAAWAFLGFVVVLIVIGLVAQRDKRPSDTDDKK